MGTRPPSASLGLSWFERSLARGGVVSLLTGIIIIAAGLVGVSDTVSLPLVGGFFLAGGFALLVASLLIFRLQTNWGITTIGYHDKANLWKHGRSLLRNQWLFCMAIATLVFQSLIVIRAILRGGSRTDSLLFQHIGWYITQGGMVYVDAWEIKPPTIYWLAAGLAYLTGGDMYLLHIIGLILTSAAFVVGVVLVGVLTHRVTEDVLATYCAVGVLYTPALLYVIPSLGLGPKPFALVAACVAILLARDGRIVLASVAAALTASLWQMAVVIPFVVLLFAAGQPDRLRSLIRSIAAMGLTAILVVLPAILSGATEEMIVQAIVIPLLVSEPTTVWNRMLTLVLGLGYATVLIPIAGVGLYRVRDRLKDEWWLVVCLVWFTIQVLVLDMDSVWDMIFWLPFVAIAVGLFVHHGSERERRLVATVLVVLILVGPMWVLASPPPKESIESVQPTAENTIEPPENAMTVGEMYWEKIEPASCHYRFSETELLWIARTSAEYGDQHCGSWAQVEEWRELE